MAGRGLRLLNAVVFERVAVARRGGADRPRWGWPTPPVTLSNRLHAYCWFPVWHDRMLGSSCENSALIVIVPDGPGVYFIVDLPVDLRLGGKECTSVSACRIAAQQLRRQHLPARMPCSRLSPT